MQDNALQTIRLPSPRGSCSSLVGLVVARLLPFIVRTATETTILPGQHFRLKHFILALVVAAAARARLLRPSAQLGDVRSDELQPLRRTINRHGADRLRRPCWSNSIRAS